ncbi:alpha/beta hydrolase family protein [Nocardioides caricicola]|uniref:Alpha/beta hydrolase family protein n=1 Tax=Nocardioides caricicola TaxID=634770 RepID=A0ABW0N5M7_9ACTN
MAARSRSWGDLVRVAALGVALGVALGFVACTGTPSDSPDGAPATASATPTSTLTYAPGLTADLYLPRAGRRVALVVMVPGGGWMTADPTGFAGLAAALAAGGAAAAPVHIRAAEDGVTYPAPVDDVLCAVSAIVHEVQARRLVPDPVVVLGHSSGAHLAALAVLAVDDFAPTCRHPVVRPDALIGLSGPYDISRVPDLASALLGTTPDEDPAGWSSANPVERAGLRPEVPVLLLHGERDDQVPVGFTIQLDGALESAGHPTTVELVPEATHDTIYTGDVSAELVLAWLDSVI